VDNLRRANRGAMQDSSLQTRANESRLALQDVKTFLRAPNETRYTLTYATFWRTLMIDSFLLSKDELLETPPITPKAVTKNSALDKRASLGAFDAPNNVDHTTVSLPSSVSGPCGLFYFVRRLVRC
jgi:hypothetical protein